MKIKYAGVVQLVHAVPVLRGLHDRTDVRENVCPAAVCLSAEMRSQ